MISTEPGKAVGKHQWVSKIKSLTKSYFQVRDFGVDGYGTTIKVEWGVLGGHGEFATSNQKGSPRASTATDVWSRVAQHASCSANVNVGIVPTGFCN